MMGDQVKQVEWSNGSKWNGMEWNGVNETSRMG
jgi:hypothetical protein